MDDKQLREAVKAIVDGIFSEKEEDARQKMTEDAITKSTATINDLTNALASQQDAFSELETKHTEAVATAVAQEATIATIEADKKKLEEELVIAKEELEKVKVDLTTVTASSEVVTKELSELKAVIAEVEKAKVAEERYLDLVKDGIGYKNKEKQLAKIKEMSDEEFASYKEELLSVKEALTETSEAITDDAVVDVAGAEAIAASAGTALAQVSRTAFIVAALNSELKDQDDMVKKYKDLGLAMAANIKKDIK